MFLSQLGPDQRDSAISQLGTEQFDILVIGGGVNGVGAALDAASSAAPTPLTPPPITRMSNCSVANWEMAESRWSGPSCDKNMRYISITIEYAKPNLRRGVVHRGLHRQFGSGH